MSRHWAQYAATADRWLIGAAPTALQDDEGSLVAVTAILVTGNPGAGKSTVAEELAGRGYTAIDPDHDPELAFWLDRSGNRVSLAHGPLQPDSNWLQSHRWVWDRGRLEQVLTESRSTVFVCGIARNLDEVLDLFDRVFLLRIDERTQEQRLAAHDAARPPGRNEAGRQQIREGRPVFEAQMLEKGAIPLDGGAPPPRVVEALLAKLSTTGDRLL